MACVTFDADEPASMRQERLNTFLQDFDLEVSARADQMRLHLKDVEAKMKKTLMLQLIRLPKQIKSMTIEEFQGVYGGDMDAIVEAQTQVAVDAMMVEESTKKSSRKRVLTNKTNSASTGRVGKRGKKSTVVANQTLRRSTRTRSVLANSSFVTPAPRSARSKIVQATPAFDPRLPKTPFLRQPRRGESIMSMNGSPLAMGATSIRGSTKQSIITVPLDNGKAIELSTDMDLSEVTSNLNKRSRKDAVNKLQDLQSQIQDLMAQLA